MDPANIDWTDGWYYHPALKSWCLGHARIVAFVWFAGSQWWWKAGAGPIRTAPGFALAKFQAERAVGMHGAERKAA